MTTKPKGMKAKEYLDALDVGAKCAICGNDDRVVLQWAHKDPADKLFNIGNSWRSYGLASVAAEVAKCVRLCCNCHLRADAGLIDITNL